jgi:hypothetical protein
MQAFFNREALRIKTKKTGHIIIAMTMGDFFILRSKEEKYF